MIARTYPHILTAFLLFLLSVPLRAQQSPASEDHVRIAFEQRLSRSIKLMTTRVNAENNELNDRITAMNKSDPLAMRNLDSAHVADNVSRVLDFIEYLKHARSASDSLARDYEDSLYVLAVELPPSINSKAFQDMDATFRGDRGAFNVFLDAMNKVYSDVLDVLLYLQHTSYTINNDKFTFAAKKDMIEYQKRMKIFDADAKELKQANEAMQKANAKANDHTKDPDSELEEN
jgi:hypothetical protein